MSIKILGIVGSYRKGGIVDSLVSEVLASAARHGAQTTKIYLVDKRIEFCTNCRECTQQPGQRRGPCPLEDEMESILVQCDESDALVLGAPVNFFNVTAITRRWMERLICFAYWPWGTRGGPQLRTKTKRKRAVLITSSAMPAVLGRVFTGAPRALRIMAATLGAKPVGTIFVGMVPRQEDSPPPEKGLRKARAAGRKLAAG